MVSQPVIARSPPRWMLLSLLAAAVIVRGGVMLALAGNLDADTDDYREIAQNMHVEGSFAMSHDRVPQPTAYRPPLYPVVLYFVEFLPGDRLAIGLLHVLLGVATVYGVWRLGQLWQLPPWGSLLAGALVTVDPLLVNLSVRILTETLAAFLAVWALVALARATQKQSLGRIAWAGLLVALCALCRPTFLVWLGAVALAMPLVFDDRKILPRMAVFLAVAAAVLMPWTVRNQILLGRPIVTTTHGGYTVLLGNNPSFYEFVRTELFVDLWDPNAFFRWWNAERIFVDSPRGPVMDELASDRRANELAYATIRAEPGMFVAACFVRIGWLWGVLPHQIDPHESAKGRAMRYAVAVWYSVELLLALVGLWSLGKKSLRAPWAWGVLLLLSFTAVHSVYWTDMRMRAPLMPVVALLAAQGAVLLASRRRAATS